MLYKHVAEIIAKVHKYHMRQKGKSKNGNSKEVGILNKQYDLQLVNANSTLERH